MVKPQHIGSSRTGLGEWLVQRISAVYMSGFVVYLVLRFSLAPIDGYEAWVRWFSGGGVRIATALFFASALVHAWIGMRSVYMDYLKPLWLRLSVSVATAAGLLVLALWAADVLLMGGGA